MNQRWKKIALKIRSDEIAIIPTDTLYGIVGKALDKKVVEEIYKIKKRTPTKPFIILISSIKDLDIFGVNLSERDKKILQKVWPGKVSVILKTKKLSLDYLTRKTNSLAFRIPKKKPLLELLKVTGPLVAPSANPESLPPAQNIAQAKKYFGKWSRWEKGKRMVPLLL